MSTLPIILNTPKILLIGGGAVALQKAQVLHRNGIDFCTIALHVKPELETLCSVTCKAFEINDLEGYEIIIDATGNPQVLQTLLHVKKERRFLLNCVDVPEACDFFFAALIERGALKVAVSSAGASPTMAQTIRDHIARQLPKSLEDLADALAQKRALRIIDRQSAKVSTQRLLGRVSLVGCGTGDAELLTLKAYKIIQEADVVLTDHLISPEIMALVPPRTLQIFVGKKKGHHSIKQEAINDLLMEYAAKGHHVARLKAGDPYIFGRGSEEALALIDAGIHVSVIPGVSSAIAAPSCAGIAPTARGVATGMSIVSAHLRGDRLCVDWIDLLLRPSHTVVVLMGTTRAREIVEAARSAGVRENLPVAIVSNASRVNQERRITVLSGLEEAAKGASRPSLLIFGDAVALSSKLPQYLEEVCDERLAAGF